MSEVVQLASNAVVAKLINPSKDTKNIVRELLSYRVEGAEFSKTFSKSGGGWDGRSSFFSMVNTAFPAGFTHMVHEELTRRGVKVHLIRQPLPKSLGPENPIVDEFGNDDPRYDYQMRVVDQVLKHGRGIAQIATGGGKSKVAKLVTARIRRPTLFLTTRGVLMHQMKRDYEKAGFKVGVLGDGEWTPVRGVNVGMVQTLVERLTGTSLDDEVRKLIARRAAFEEKQIADLKIKLKAQKIPLPKIYEAVEKLENELEASRSNDAELAAKAKEAFEAQTRWRERTIKFLELIELVIGEEAHEAGGNSYYEILRHCKNANYRLALTATPFMRADGEDNMRLMAAFGPILIKVSEKTLIDRGILAKPYFKYIECDPPPKLYKTTSYQRAYSIGIVENLNRNAAIVRETLKASRRHLPVMILIKRKAHGAVLQGMLESKGLRARFIHGEADQSTRQKALNDLGSGVIHTLIGTTILDVGVDVPAVGMVILAGGDKAEVSLRQRTGRGLRAKKVGPNVAFIVDFMDGVNTHLRDHARQRRAIIEATDGFAENILQKGADFDWSMFDQERSAA